MGFTSSKRALAYTIYMMLGSYFKKAVCTSTIKEGQLRIAYNEQKKDNQVKYEEYCDRYIEDKIVPDVPEVIFDDMVEVSFIEDNSPSISVIFVGFDWKITMWAEEENNYIHFKHEYEEIS